MLSGLFNKLAHHSGHARFNDSNADDCSPLSSPTPLAENEPLVVAVTHSAAGRASLAQYVAKILREADGDVRQIIKEI